jgi:hypothetical protein
MPKVHSTSAIRSDFVFLFCVGGGGGGVVAVRTFFPLDAAAAVCFYLHAATTREA